MTSNASSTQPMANGRSVLDAFALLALLRDEPAAERVSDILRSVVAREHEALMSVVNLGEVLYNLERERGPRRTARMLAELRRVPIQVVPITRRRAFRAARLKAHYRLGYADAFAAALAAEFGATLLTGDDDFRAVDGLVAIEWLPIR